MACSVVSEEPSQFSQTTNPPQSRSSDPPRACDKELFPPLGSGCTALQGALFSEFMLSSKGVTTNAAAGSGGAAGATAVNSGVTCAAPGFLWVRTVCGPRLWPACPAKGVSSILNVRSASPRRPGPPPTPAARLPPGSPCRSCGPAPFPHVPWESSCGQRL